MWIEGLWIEGLRIPIPSNVNGRIILPYNGKFGEHYNYLVNEPFIKHNGFLFGVSGMATTALTLHPPENINLAINDQITKLKLPPNFPVMRYTV